MRHQLLSGARRRRIRLIKSVEEQSEQGLLSAASALSIASETEAARHDLDFVRHQFVSDCRPNSSAKLRVELPGISSTEISLDRPLLVIGRDPNCDLQLDHADVSARHLFLIWIEGHLFCCDISSDSGLSSRRQNSLSSWWVDQTPIPVGPYLLTLAGEKSRPVDCSPLERSERLSTEYPLLALQFEGVSQKNNVWPINRVLTLIGRTEICKLRLNHRTIAPVQACLLRTSTGCWLIDLADNGMTLINGRSEPLYCVDIGDELRFGRFYAEVGSLSVPKSKVQDTVKKPPISAPVPTVRQESIVSDQPLAPAVVLPVAVNSAVAEPIAVANPVVSAVEEMPAAVVYHAPTVLPQAAETVVDEELQETSAAEDTSASFAESTTAPQQHDEPATVVCQAWPTVNVQPVVEDDLISKEPTYDEQISAAAEAVNEVVTTMPVFAPAVVDFVVSEPVNSDEQTGTFTQDAPPAVVLEPVPVVEDVSACQSVAHAEVREEILPYQVAENDFADHEVSPAFDEPSYDQVEEESVECAGIARLIVVHQTQMAELKIQTLELKRTLNTASCRHISEKLREALAQPLLEILKLQDSLEQNLAELTQATTEKTV